MRSTTPSAQTSLRILHVVEAASAGVGRHVRDLVGGLSKLGLSQAVAYSSQRADNQFLDAARRWTEEGLAVVEIPMTRAVSPARDIRSLRALLRFLRSAAPFDLLHGHSSKGGALARIAAAFSSGRAVYTPHAMAFTGTHFSRPRRALYWLFEFVLRPLTDGFVAVSEGEAAAAARARLVPADKLFLVHNGIRAPSESELAAGRAERDRTRGELGIDADRFALLSAGRLSHQKGPDILVRAAERVIHRHPEAVFVWAGDGELRPDVENEVVRRKLQAHFRLLGQRDDLPRLLPAVDAFVMPSRYEGLPYALLEAMAAGLPIIGTRASGIRDLVEDERSGLLIDQLDPSGVAAAVQRLLDQGPKRRAAMGLAARELVARRYTIERMVSETLEAYSAILELGGRGVG